jgi:hypothetical protein
VNGQSTDGPALQQALNEPHGMAVASGNGLGAGGVPDIYIAETWWVNGSFERKCKSAI